MSSSWLFYLTVAIIIVTLVLFVIFKCCCRVVPHKHTMIIERLGKFRSQCKPGLYCVLPFIDKIRKIDWCYTVAYSNSRGIGYKIHHENSELVDLRERVLDFEQQAVITKDLAAIRIDAVLYYKIIDPRLAVLRIVNMPYQLQLLTQSALRNIFAELTLDESLTSRDTINTQLHNYLSSDCPRSGVAVTRVEIQNILVNNEMTDAMARQLIAERKRRSIVLLANGQREQNIVASGADATVSAIAAEARKQVLIQDATAQAAARLTLAQADAEALELIQTALAAGNSSLTCVQYTNQLDYFQQLGQQRNIRELCLLERGALASRQNSPDNKKLD